MIILTFGFETIFFSNRLAVKEALLEIIVIIKFREGEIINN